MASVVLDSPVTSWQWNLGLPKKGPLHLPLESFSCPANSTTCATLNCSPPLYKSAEKYHFPSTTLGNSKDLSQAAAVPGPSEGSIRDSAYGLADRGVDLRKIRPGRDRALRLAPRGVVFRAGTDFAATWLDYF